MLRGELQRRKGKRGWAARTKNQKRDIALFEAWLFVTAVAMRHSLPRLLCAGVNYEFAVDQLKQYCRLKRQAIQRETMLSPVVKNHGPHSPPALELFACSRLKLGNSVHGGAETIPFLNVLPLLLVKRVVHVGGRQDDLQHFPARRVLRRPYSLEVSELHGCGITYSSTRSTAKQQAAITREGDEEKESMVPRGTKL